MPSLCSTTWVNAAWRPNFRTPWSPNAPPGEAGAPRQVKIALEGWTGTPRVHVEIVDRDHGDALTAWRGLGSPAFPTPRQYEQLRRAAASTLKLDTPTFDLPAQ